jgi:hypothetical protein
LLSNDLIAKQLLSEPELVYITLEQLVTSFNNYVSYFYFLFAYLVNGLLLD